MLNRIVSAVFLVAGMTGIVQAQATPPADICSISQQGFANWFVNKKPAKGGVVTFANSVGFPKQNTACDFFKWAHQMFLWTTSPLQGGIVLDSTVFYDVNFDKQGNGVFVSNGPNSFALRGAKPQSIQAGGQAGGGDTLLSLGGSLVYFGINVNDVYAWFNTAVTNGVMPATSPFPTTQAELSQIVKYAAANKVKLVDANALTMEFKTAWVDAATVANPAEYITVAAVVPNYSKVNTTTWTVNAQQPTISKKLALVGIHVVGPVQGHPEMVWATFEHKRNAPDNTYYVTGPGASQVIKTVPYDSKGAWNFMTPGGSQDGALVAQMVVGQTSTPPCANGSICATPGKVIQQNNVYRAKPWGNAPTAASGNNNGQLISLNSQINKTLAGLGDVRANYFQVGAVWTQDGSIPSSGNDTAKQKGSKLLANTTMETYHQINKNGCFACHAASTSIGTSHLFSPTNNPLVPKK